MTTYKKIKDWFEEQINWIHNCFKWYSILKTDRDFDWWYALYVFQYKLKKLRECIDKNQTHVGCEKHVEQIHRCEVIIQRILNDDYVFGAADFEGVFGEKEEEKNSTPFEVKVNTRFPFKYRDVHKYNDYMAKQDLDYLFMMLKKHMKSWWD